MRAMLVLMAFLSIGQAFSEQVRLKDIAEIEGMGEELLFGYGLVVGLNGTGDSSSYIAAQSVSNMLKRLGITVPPDQIRLRNVAAVMVTAKLPPFAKPGARIDVTVSSIGDARSLVGGTLLPTPLRTSFDPETVYAIAQGEISIGGYRFGARGALAQKNHPTVGRIPGGGIVVRGAEVKLAERGSLTLILDEPDFTTASRVVEAINDKFGSKIASAVDGGTIKLTVPQSYRDDLVRFIAEVESIKVEPDTVARVVIDERTGTVVIGKDVRISTVAVAHGDIRVEISTTAEVYQPYPESAGQTAVVESSRVDVTEEGGSVALIESNATIGQLAAALNAIGATPQDLIAILQNIAKAGALKAKLIVR